MAWVGTNDPTVLNDVMEQFAAFFLSIGWTVTTEDWTGATNGESSAAAQ